MILEKLLKNKVATYGTVIWPLYQIFKGNLKVVKFSDVKIIHGTHLEFKNTVKADLEKNGLLCPMVLNRDYELVNGNHRFKVLQTLGDASIFYVANNDAEENFLSRVNVEVWKMHPEVKDLSFCFKGKMEPYTNKCLHLFSNVTRVAR